ncbi:MAG: integrase catalytic domain-containing protein [Lachnospira eligens]
MRQRLLCNCTNEKWTTDVTEFKIPGEKKKLYLSAILDLYDRYCCCMLSAREIIMSSYLKPLIKLLPQIRS